MESHPNFLLLIETYCAQPTTHIVNAMVLSDSTPSHVLLMRKANNAIQQGFTRFGYFCAKNPVKLLVGTVLVFSCFLAGLKDITFEDDVYALWIRTDSRLHNERDFIEEQFGDVRSRSQFALAHKDGQNILTEASLDSWLEFSLYLTQSLSVTHNGTAYHWNDVCDRVYNPFIDLPCTKYTVLDCFTEGQFDFFLPPAPGLPPNYYNLKPSYKNLTTEQIGLVIDSGSCSGWSGAPTPENFMVGGVKRDATSGTIASVDSFQLVFELSSFDAFAKRIFATSSPSSSELQASENIILAWEKAFIDGMSAFEHKYDFEIEYFAKRSEKDLMTEASEGDAKLIAIGYVMMILFASLVFFKKNLVESRILASITGVLLVLLGVFSSLGLSHMLGITFTPMHLQVLPFLALGLGVDDMFVLVYNFKVTGSRSIEENTARCMAEAGSSITLTSLVNMIAFFIGSSMPLPSITHFCMSAAIVVIVNYIILMFAFTSVLVLDARRTRSNRYDVLPCFTFAGNLNLHKRRSSHNILSDASSASFGKMAVHPVTRVVALIATAVLVGLAAHGVGQVEDGLPLAEVVPTSHYSHDFLALREESYTDYEASFVIGMDKNTGKATPIDYANSLAEIMAAELQLQTVSTVNPAVPIPALSWVDNFAYYVATTHPANVTAQGLPEPSLFYPLLYEWLGTASGISFLSRFKFDTNGAIVASSVKFFQTKISTATDMINAIEVSWRWRDAVVLFLFVFAFLPTFPSLPLHLVSVTHTFNLSLFLLSLSLSLFPFSSVVTLLTFSPYQDSRDALDKQAIHMFPEGFVYNFYEQYLHVREDLLENLLWVSIGVAVVSLSLLLHPGASLIMISVIALIVFEVYGFLHYFVIRMNGVSAVNLIIAVRSLSLSLSLFLCLILSIFPSLSSSIFSCLLHLAFSPSYPLFLSPFRLV